MGDFSIYNSFDQSTQTPSAGAAVVLNVGPGSLVTVYQDAYTTVDTPTNVSLSNNAILEPVTIFATSAGGSDYSTVWVGSIPPQTAPGQYHVGILFQLQNQPLALIVNVGHAAGGAPSITLPADVFDCNVDLFLRKFTSSRLPQITGIKATDGPVKFGVIPFLGGSFVDTGISAIQITARPVGTTGGLYLGDPLVQSVSTPDLEGTSPNEYYLVPLSFSDDVVTNWFSQMNADAQSGVTADSGATVNVDKLQVNAEIQITMSSGQVITSDNFQFWIYQSQTVPSP